jgi:hypothetical protein
MANSLMVGAFIPRLVHRRLICRGFVRLPTATRQRSSAERLRNFPIPTGSAATSFSPRACVRPRHGFDWLEDTPDGITPTFTIEHRLQQELRDLIRESRLQLRR